MSKTTANKRIGKRLKKLRTSHGMSQASLAEACGVNQKTISSWEYGVPMPAAHAVTLTKCFGTSLDYLLRGHQPRFTSAVYL